MNFESVTGSSGSFAISRARRVCSGVPGASKSLRPVPWVRSMSGGPPSSSPDPPTGTAVAAVAVDDAEVDGASKCTLATSPDHASVVIATVCCCYWHLTGGLVALILVRNHYFALWLQVLLPIALTATATTTASAARLWELRHCCCWNSNNKCAEVVGRACATNTSRMSIAQHSNPNRNSPHQQHLYPRICHVIKPSITSLSSTSPPTTPTASPSSTNFNSNSKHFAQLPQLVRRRLSWRWRRAAEPSNLTASPSHWCSTRLRPRPTPPSSLQMGRM